MSKKIKQVNIFLGDEKTKSEVADGLRIIAEKIEEGYTSGIAGWSDLSWDIDYGEENEEE